MGDSKNNKQVKPSGGLIREHKEYEESILQEKRFSETVINSLPGIFYLYDSKWRMVHWNRNHELLTGFSADELKGRMLLDWFSEDFKDNITAAVRKVFDEGEAMVEAPLLIKDGIEVPYLFKGVRLEVADEVYLMGMGIDISERKAKDAVILQEKRFTETAINSLPGIFYLYDSDWRMVHWNRNHELLTGYSADELKGRMLLDWFSEDFKDNITAAVRKVFDEGEAMVEAPLLIKDGIEVPYLFKGVRLEVAGEVYLMGMGIDISERKANEEALQQREQQLRLITDSLPALIAHIDSNQRYIFVNESYAKWVGYPRNEIRGKHLSEVLGEDIYKEIRERVETVLSGQPVTFESVIRSLTSELHHMLAMYVPDCREGSIQGYFASIHDVTDLEQAKEQAQIAREALYHIGRVITLDALSSSLAHEMQQPLTGVLSNAQAVEMLLEAPQPNINEIRVMIKDIVADAKRAGDVMWRMRELMRKKDTNFQILYLNRLIEDVLNMLKSDMVIHNIVVARDFAVNLPGVMGDSVQIQQVLINLILNAQQAMQNSPSEGNSLVIHTSVGREGEIILVFEDSGPGIEESKLKQIFEPFYTTRSEGTGMGLAISRFIIEAHGGKIWAENKTDGGMRICFSLPVVAGSADSS